MPVAWHENALLPVSRRTRRELRTRTDDNRRTGSEYATALLNLGRLNLGAFRYVSFPDYDLPVFRTEPELLTRARPSAGNLSIHGRETPNASCTPENGSSNGIAISRLPAAVYVYIANDVYSRVPRERNGRLFLSRNTIGIRSKNKRKNPPTTNIAISWLI